MINWEERPATIYRANEAGTPEPVADLIEDWFADGATDGFNIMSPLLPAMLDVFSAEVIPLLQRRALFRTTYEGRTLREHHGLAWPKSTFKEAALQERKVMTTSSKARIDADAKAQRATDGAQAMADYVADGEAVRAKTARLKELRLAKEAAEKEAEKEPVEKKRKPSRRAASAPNARRIS